MMNIKVSRTQKKPRDCGCKGWRVEQVDENAPKAGITQLPEGSTTKILDTIYKTMFLNAR